MRYDPMHPPGNAEPASAAPTTPKPRRAKKATAPASLVAAIDRVPDDAIVFLLAEAGHPEADLLCTRLNFRAWGQQHAEQYRDWRVAWKAFAEAGMPIGQPTTDDRPPTAAVPTAAAAPAVVEARRAPAPPARRAPAPTPVGWTPRVLPPPPAPTPEQASAATAPTDDLIAEAFG